MKGIRTVSYIALVVAYLQIVFGAIVRISGSGLGCGDHWPNCSGYWFPPLDRPDLIIEFTHRLLALCVTLAILVLLALAWRRRDEPGVGGRGGVLRAAMLAIALVLTAAVFGAVTVKMELNPFVIVTHLAIAMTLLATLAAAAMRAGGLGAASVQATDSRRIFRSARAGAGVAFLVLVLGALTANIPGANVACLGFPFCGEFMGPNAHLQLTHRVLAYLLALHVIGMTAMTLKRGEQPPVRLAVLAALAAVLAQIAIAAVMVLGHLRPEWRSAHQAMGTLVWLSLFIVAMLAKRSLRPSEAPASGAGYARALEPQTKGARS